jgi:hypothetical protein
MTSVRHDMTIREARDLTLQFTIIADPGQTLDGADIDFWIARYQGSNDLVLEKSVGDGITITGSLTFDVEIEPADTEGMDGNYYFEAVVRTTPDDNRVTAVHGFITVEPSLAQPPP